MRREKESSKGYKLLSWLLVIALLLSIALCLYLRYRPPEPMYVSTGTLELHFIDVGQGDAALILCNGHAMLIDGGTSQNSGRIYTYLVKQNIKTLDYIIATHPHDDHVGGLAGALNAAKAERAFCSTKYADGRAFESFLKYLDLQGVSIEVPEPGDTFELGSARFTVLGPLRYSPNVNDTSLVIRFSFGRFHALFTADAETQEEADILRSRAEVESDLLKVGHHGSTYSSSEAWIEAVHPKTAVISCGKDNDYGHPAQQTLDRLHDVGAEILRTDRKGDIVFVVNVDGSYGPKEEMVVRDQEITYVVNTKSNKFHDPSCSSAATISEQNRLNFTGTREELVELGYEPCGRCKP